jgi:hypothetical protein
MRGEGTAAAVRRSTAALREWRSCTNLFQHRSSPQPGLPRTRSQVADGLRFQMTVEQQVLEKLRELPLG